MSVWVVIGGQFGSEGKGKIAAAIVRQEKIDICVRCGGPNSGHCVIDDDGNIRALRQIPTGFLRHETRLLIPSGGLIDLEVLKSELDLLKLGPDRVGVDRHAMVVEQQDRSAELDLGLRARISSTLSGVGSAVSRRVLRGENVNLAENAAQTAVWLRPYLSDVSEEVQAGIDRGRKVLVEGTQGFGLSLYHSSFYPKSTSRDTTASGFLSECGISPVQVTEIVLVMRTYPIRVAGDQAGPLLSETDWKTVEVESKSPRPIAEYTTVTGKLRRIGSFDIEMVRRAARLNRPTRLAVNFLDYLSFDDRRATHVSELSEKSRTFLGQVSRELSIPVRYVGVGPKLEETLFLDGKVPTSAIFGVAHDESRRSA